MGQILSRSSSVGQTSRSASDKTTLRVLDGFLVSLLIFQTLSSIVLVSTTPVASSSWNPSVPCNPVVVTIEQILGNQSSSNGGATLEGSIFNPAIHTDPPTSGAKRDVNPWFNNPLYNDVVNVDGNCFLTDAQGQFVSAFVEVTGVKVLDIQEADCNTSWSASNGGGSYPSSSPRNCDTFGNLETQGTLGTCSSMDTSACMHRIHYEIDRDWKAAGLCGPGVSHCDNRTLMSTPTGSLLDMQGFVYWDGPPNESSGGRLESAYHQYSGWEIHPVSAWKPSSAPPPSSSLTATFSYSPSSPSPGQSITFTASVGGGSSPYVFTWDFGDGQKTSGNPVSHVYPSTGSFVVTLDVTDASSPPQQTSSSKTLQVSNTQTRIFQKGSGGPYSETDDSYIDSGSTTLQGSASLVKTDGECSGVSNRICKGLITFPNFIGPDADQIAPGTTIQSATLDLLVYDSGNTQQLYQVSEAWSESTVAWTTFATPGSPSTGSLISSFSGTVGIRSLDITAVAQNWLNGEPNYGILLVNTGPDGVRYRSSEYGTITERPRLTVKFGVISLAADFTWSPFDAISGETVTFTADVSGGSPPYVFEWNFGDGTSGTVNPATHVYSLGTYTVTLTVSDGSSPSQTVSSSDVITVQPPPGGPVPPLMVGWGGIRIGESILYSSPLVSSRVFLGEDASNAELEMLKLSAKGYNTIRLMFDSPMSQASRTDPYWKWNPEWFERSVTIAEALSLLVVVDFHGYCDWIYPHPAVVNPCVNGDEDSPGAFTADQDLKTQWIAWWRDNVIVPYKKLYSGIVWQPINEPIVSDAAGVWPGPADVLQRPYQDWVDMARGAGDGHWIAISNANWDGDWPTVSDPLNKIILDRHWYFFYPTFLSTGGYHSFSYDANGNYQHSAEVCATGWSNACAEAYANSVSGFILKAEERHSRPHISLEIGADDTNTDQAPPDHVETVSCNYSNVTLHFVQTLINRFDMSARRGYVLWHAGDWSAAGLYGCMESPQWGSLLNFEPVTSPNTPPALTVPGPQTIGEDELLNFIVSANDPDSGQAITLTATSMPSGASFDAATGTFSWRPSETQGPGDYSVVFTATDNGTPLLSDVDSVAIHVNEVNSPPVINEIPNRTVDEEMLLTFTIIASDPDVPGNTLTLSAVSLPAGAVFDPLTGTFSWIPNESQGPATQMVTFRVTDNGTPQLSSTGSVAISVNEVNRQPAVSVPGPQTVVEGSTITFKVTATDSDIPTNLLTLSANALPTGASFPTPIGTGTIAGIFTWTPVLGQASSSPYTISFLVSDSGAPSLSDSRSVTIIVQAQQSAQTIILRPADDSYVRPDYPDRNFGTATTLQVDGSPIKHFLMKFTLPNASCTSIASARLRLFVVDSSDKGGEFRRVVDNSWSETTVTWNNAPPADTDVLASFGQVSAGNWIEVDLTPYVSCGSTFTIRVTSSSSNGADYSSKEATNIPELFLMTESQTTTSALENTSATIYGKLTTAFGLLETRRPNRTLSDA